MIIKLLPKAISASVSPEEQLADNSILESIYEIRKLRAAIDLADKEINIGPLDNTHSGSVFLESHDIWISGSMWVEVK